MSYSDYPSTKLPSTELRAGRTGLSAALRAGSGKEERKIVSGIVFPYLLLLFSGGRDVIKLPGSFSWNYVK
jgi:hypothetical protein